MANDMDILAEFNGFIFEPQQGATKADVEDFVKKTLGEGWNTEAISARASMFITKPKHERIDTRQAWSLYYKLLQGPFIFVESDFNTVHGAYGSRLNPCPDGHLSATKPYDWALKQVDADKAWGLTLGEGIIIGHTDTGYTRHKEIWKDPPPQGYGLQPGLGWDYADADNDASAKTAGSRSMDFYSHGTSTASVIMSDHNDGGYIKGIAPRALLIPIRVDSSVWVNLEKLIRGIDYAIYKGAHITSTSMGDPFGNEAPVDRILKEAIDNGVIPVAAAGQLPPFELNMEILPAKSAYAVSCTATTAERKPWKKAFKSRSITIAAPGESVWKAEAVREITYGTTVDRSCGTSFSTAITAGAAALWYAHVKPGRLHEAFGKNNVFYAYLQTLSEHGIVPWNYDMSGPGILNVYNHLTGSARSLPDVQSLSHFKEDYLTKRTRSHTRKTADLIDAANSDTCEAALSALLNKKTVALESFLETAGPELRFHITANSGLRNMLADYALNFRKDIPINKGMLQKLTTLLEGAASSQLIQLLTNN